MPSELAKAYDPEQVESSIYEYWLDQQVMNAEVNPAKEPYCIVIPPPTSRAPCTWATPWTRRFRTS